MPASPSPALEYFLHQFRCPVCGADNLESTPGALRCPKRHTFNVARQGYVSLLSGTKPTSGDDAAMIQARDRFLATGAYEPIRHAISAMAARTLPDNGSILDIGCGTGYYMEEVLEHSPAAHGLGFDTSVRALRMAARVHPRVAAVSWDVFRPFPLADECADVVLNVFAPRNPSEFHRVLRDDGRLIIVRPTSQHLAEIREEVPGAVTIDATKEHRLHSALDPYFELAEEERIEYVAALEAQDAHDLLFMTPSARHIEASGLTERGDLPTEVTVSVHASAYRPR